MFYDKWYMRALQIESIISSKGWVYVSSGKERRVWKRGNVVLKIAYTESGLLANKRERFLYRHNRNRNYAPCRLVQDNILVMRAVSVLDDLNPVQYKLIPDWAHHLNDGPQVGIDRRGNILIYDYAEEIPISFTTPIHYKLVRSNYEEDEEHYHFPHR
jgi:hypothetical protein